VALEADAHGMGRRHAKFGPLWQSVFSTGVRCHRPMAPTFHDWNFGRTFFCSKPRKLRFPGVLGLTFHFKISFLGAGGAASGRWVPLKNPRLQKKQISLMI